MKYTYIAVTVEENGKYYAYVVKVSESDNILSKLDIKGILHANIYGTKKKCEEVVESWNKSYKQNGKYMFDISKF